MRKVPNDRKKRFWKRAIKLSVAGIVLPPLPGMAMTAYGMIQSFQQRGAGTELNEAAQAESVSSALLMTASLLPISFIAIIFLIVSMSGYKALPSFKLTSK